jgi:hypothetical protein
MPVAEWFACQLGGRTADIVREELTMAAPAGEKQDSECRWGSQGGSLDDEGLGDTHPARTDAARKRATKPARNAIAIE